MHDPKGSFQLIIEAINDLNRKAHGDTFTAKAVTAALQPHVQALEALLPKDKGDDQN